MHLLFGISTLSLFYNTAFASPFPSTSNDATPSNSSDDARLNGGHGLPFPKSPEKRTPGESVAVNVDGSTGTVDVTIGPMQPPAGPAAAANANTTTADKSTGIYSPKAIALSLQAKRGAGRFADGTGLIGLKEGDNMAGPMPSGVRDIDRDGEGEIGVRPGEIIGQGMAALGIRPRPSGYGDHENDNDDEDDRRKNDRDKSGPPPPPPGPGPTGDVDNRSGAQGVGGQPFAPFAPQYAPPPPQPQPQPQLQAPPQRDRAEEEENQHQEAERQNQERERQRQKDPAIAIGHSGDDEERPDIRQPQAQPVPPPPVAPAPRPDIRREREQAPPPSPPPQAQPQPGKPEYAPVPAPPMMPPDVQRDRRAAPPPPMMRPDIQRDRGAPAPAPAPEAPAQQPQKPGYAYGGYGVGPGASSSLGLVSPCFSL